MLAEACLAGGCVVVHQDDLSAAGLGFSRSVGELVGGDVAADRRRSSSTKPCAGAEP